MGGETTFVGEDEMSNPTDYIPHVMASSQTNFSRTIVEQVTLRDQFAMAALTGIARWPVKNGCDEVAKLAYLLADNMLAAREEKK